MDIDFVVKLVIVIVILMIFFAILSSFGLNPAELIIAVRGTRRVKPDQEPRDQLERFYHNHRKSAKDSKPRNLKYLWYFGDRDVPPKRVGKVIGLEPHQSAYIVYVRTSRFAWSKLYIVPRELASDVNRRNLMIYCRGFSTTGAYRFPLPRGKDHNEMVMRSHDDFKFLFRLQILQDADEDTAWAVASGMMPAFRDRVKAAELEVPNIGNRPYVPEDQVGGK